MRGHQIKLFIFEFREILREIKNSRYFVDSWTQFSGIFHSIFFRSRTFSKTF
uniref:Ycf2 N-terminal domain-containing protein n=1 Tax=Tristicha trifaria TaxID=51607 RepID=A0A6M8TTJ4_9ROSI|nr:hypothetical protein RF2 [Tristicha trifaria]YP_009869846.1 hypothetical protein RF2 [Tristicha trifaria]QKJ81770.1 hypothetical protein RF2 [Tristicha trifaria]QKJ81787.1 hypothetical protein RF2 [Tristicha trifaria]